MPTRTTRSTTSLNSLLRQSPTSPLKNASGTAQAVRWVLNSIQAERRKPSGGSETHRKDAKFAKSKSDWQRKRVRCTTPLCERRKHGQSPSLCSQILPSLPSPLLLFPPLLFSSPLFSPPLFSSPLFSSPLLCALCASVFPILPSFPSSPVSLTPTLQTVWNTPQR